VTKQARKGIALFVFGNGNTTSFVNTCEPVANYKFLIDFYRENIDFVIIA
jgi:hypothetical protein